MRPWRLDRRTPVVSHWFLDLPMHRPDLPLWPGASSPKPGFGRWNFFVVTCVIELTVYAAGVWLYARALAWTTLLIWLFVPLAWWIDKHRYYVGRIDVPIEHLRGR